MFERTDLNIYIDSSQSDYQFICLKSLAYRRAIDFCM